MLMTSQKSLTLGYLRIQKLIRSRCTLLPRASSLNKQLCV